MGKPRAFACVALLLSAAPRPLLADPVRIEPSALSWTRSTGADSCPSGPDVAKAVEARLGRQALVPTAQAELVVEAYVERNAELGFRVVMKLVRGEAVIGRREIETTEPDCSGVVEKAALAIALMIDPETPLTPPPPPQPDAAPMPQPLPPKKQAALVTEKASPATTTVTARRPWQGDLELAVGIGTGLMPNLAPGLFARGRAIPPDYPFAVELEGAYFPRQSLEAEPGKGGKFTLLLAGASLCSRPPRWTRLSGSACAGALVGSIVGEGYGFDNSPKFQAWAFVLAARGRLWFRPTPGFALLIGPDLQLPLKRDDFTTRRPPETTRLFRMSPVGLGFELGATLEL
jgi:hypothetical protein